ncbi:MAG: polyprenyl synthetase family protein [Bacteroidaceae bacterium]|nr:polyprenyl synthetase family protein [Bacteroidaceae bacterium]
MYTLQELTDKVNNYIDNNIYEQEPKRLYEPINYILSLGGKRVRPVLMLLAYNLYKDNVDDILNNAVALETYHNFTLLHDDLMDKSDMRRGNPTVHKKWDENTAILSGDAMLTLAYKLFAANNLNYGTKEMQDSYRHAEQTFIDATVGVCEGQQYDMDFEKRDDVTEVEYMEMIRLKTSLLLAAALKIGAQLANAPERDAELLYNFGEKIGLAFQLQDDVLDVFGDTVFFKKKLGADIVDNKKTFLLIKALERSEGTNKECLKDWISKENFDPEEKIKAVTNIYIKVNVKEIAEERINALFMEAITSLNDIQIEETKKAALHDFADKLLKRNH